MTVAATSRQAIEQIREEGITGTQQEQILQALQDHGHRMTRKELARHLGIEPGSIAGRVDELLKAGKLVELEPVVCEISGRKAKAVWLS